GDRLVDDVDAQFGEAIHVGLTGAVVPALHGVVEEAPDAVAVVLVVLGCVNSALSGDAVRSAGRVLDAKVQDVVTQLAQRGGGRGARQAGAHDNDRVLALIGGVYQFDRGLVVRPLILNRALGNLRVQHGLRAQGNGLPQMLNLKKPEPE